MSHEIPWSKTILSFVLDNALLTDLERDILFTRVAKGYTIKKQCLEFHISERTCHRVVRSLKDKYDALQKEYPDKIPPRRQTKYEEYLDNN